ncbi:MAG: hypothetical protein Q8O46_02780, partial [bacterium]|nr:hypothetical protein [bacterium]
VYKNAVKESDLKKEEGVLGVDFIKFSKDELTSLKEEDKKVFDRYILTDEIYEVLEYVESIDI